MKCLKFNLLSTFLVILPRVNKVPPVPQDLTVSLETLAPLVHLDHRDLMGERETKDILVLLDPLDPL